MNYPLYIVNVEAAIHRDDHWLIIKRSEKEEHAPGLLSLVGGKVETKLAENNILEETLKREILEEVGIEIFEENHYVESKSFMTDNGEYVIDIVFLCKYKSGKARCMQEEEVSEIHWMSSEELLNNESAPFWLKDSIQKAYELRLKLEKKIG